MGARKNDLDYGVFRSNRNHIKSRHVDFVIFNKENLHILAIIELDGKSHSSSYQKNLDITKNSIMQAVYGDRFYRIKVGTDFASEIKKILVTIGK